MACSPQGSFERPITGGFKGALVTSGVGVGGVGGCWELHCCFSGTSPTSAGLRPIAWTRAPAVLLEGPLNTSSSSGIISLWSDFCPCKREVLHRSVYKYRQHTPLHSPSAVGGTIRFHKRNFENKIFTGWVMVCKIFLRESFQSWIRFTHQACLIFKTW